MSAPGTGAWKIFGALILTGSSFLSFGRRDITGISFLVADSRKLYRCWNRLQDQRIVGAEKAGVCGGEARQFAAVLARPASERTLVVTFHDTCSSS
jgi:hypothetical protein